MKPPAEPPSPRAVVTVEPPEDTAERDQAAAHGRRPRAVARRHPCRTRPASRLAAVSSSCGGSWRRAGSMRCVVTSLPNILYLTNFTGSSAIVVLTADRLYFITDFRYLTVLAEARGTPHECPGLEIVTVDGSYDATLAELLAAQPWRRIGFEAAHLTVDRYRWLTATLAGERPARRRARRDRAPRRTRPRASRTRTRSTRCARPRGACRSSRRPCRPTSSAGSPSATWRSRSTGGSARPGSSARRLIRLWPVDRTPPCRTPVQGSEQ